MDKGSKAFDNKLKDVNRMLDRLDFDISEFRRKLANLRMRGRTAQSVSELEWMLKDMRRQASVAEEGVKELEQQHISCVDTVEELVDEFEAMMKNGDFQA